MGKFVDINMLKKILNKPRLMAMPGILASVLKTIITSPLAIIICKLHIIDLRPIGIWLGTYIIVSLIVDLWLYLKKDQLWMPLPKQTNIPENWKVTKEELFEYASNSPKIRLLRFLICWLLIPIGIDFDAENALIDSVGMYFLGFLICPIFDKIWLTFCNLKRPEFLIRTVLLPPKNFCDNCDPSILGSPAWNAKKNLWR